MNSIILLGQSTKKYLRKFIEICNKKDLKIILLIQGKSAYFVNEYVDIINF